MANPCDLPGADLLPVCQVVGGVQKAAAAVDAATDPFGYMAVQLQKSALGLSGSVLPALEKLTHPDLSTDWFISAYRVTFAIAIFVWVAFLAWNLVQLSRRRISGDDVAETMGFYTPMFLGGSLLGPFIGTLIVSLTGALTDSVIAWGVNGSVGTTTQALNKTIQDGDPNQMVGGAAIAIILYLALLFALLLVFLMLLVMLVTLYLTGVVIPLSLVWLVHPSQRSRGMKVVMVWIGVCASHVLLFLLLGVAFRMVSGLTTAVGDPALKVLTNLAVAIIALLMATLSPVALLKFAPVGPSSAPTSGPAVRGSDRRSGGGSQYNDDPDGDSQTGQMSREGPAATTGDETPGEGTSSGTGRGTRAGLSEKLAETKSAKDSSTSSMESGAATSEGTTTLAAGVGSAAGSGGPGAATGASSTTSKPAVPLVDAAAAGASGQPVGGDATQSAASAGEQTSQAGGRLRSTGALLDASGVAAPVGIAMQATGMALQAAGTATKKTAEMAQDAGDLAADQMNHGDDQGTGA